MTHLHHHLTLEEEIPMPMTIAYHYIMSLTTAAYQERQEPASTTAVLDTRWRLQTGPRRGLTKSYGRK